MTPKTVIRPARVVAWGMSAVVNNLRNVNECPGRAGSAEEETRNCYAERLAFTKRHIFCCVVEKGFDITAAVLMAVENWWPFYFYSEAPKLSACCRRADCG